MIMASDVMVSIIVPVYNVEKYLKECVNSIINQIYWNLEILLIDDGSSDNSGNICDQFARLDQRIKVFHKSNEGLGLTRNYGLSLSKGKYVMFVDSDDYIEDGIISRMVYVAETEEADLVVEGYKKVTTSGNIIFEEKYKYELFEHESIINLFLPRMVGSSPGKRDSIFTTVCSKLYLRNRITYHNIHFKSEREFQSEDLAFQFDIAQFLNKVIVTDKSGYFYRTNPKSLTTIYKADRFKEIKKVYLYVLDKMKRLNISKEELFRAEKMLYVQLRAVINQENPNINHLNTIQSINNIRLIMKDDIVRQSVESYPIHKLKFKQKVFLYLLKHRMAILMELLVRIKIIN